jgi:uncharacterized protein YhdP
MAASRKKIIISILAIFLLAVVSVATFSFYRLSDVEEIKKIVVANLEEALGRKVKVGEAKIDFGKGVGLRLKDVSIGGEFQGQPKLSAQTLWVVVKLVPLIEKRVEFRKIVVQGASVLVVRDAQGQSNIGGFKDWTEKPVSENSVFNFFKVSHVDKVVVEDSAVQFIDQFAGTETAPNRFALENLQVSIRKDILTRSFRFSLKGESPHLDKRSTINISGNIGNADLKNMDSGFSLDGKIKVDELNVFSFRPYIKKLLGDAPNSGRVSVDSVFSGQIGGTLTSSGKVRYTSRSPKRQPAIRDPAVAGRGILDYKVSLDGDRFKIDEFHLKSGPFESHGQGVVQPFLAKDPQVSLLLHTNPFLVDKSQSYLPLNIFPKEYHDLVHQRMKGGTLQVQTLKFEGLWTQLKNITLKKNHQRLSGTFKLSRMDWKEPLPDLKQVTGTVKMANGDQTVDIAKASYYDHPLNNIHGTIKNVIDEPEVDFSLENQVELGALHDALLKIFSDSSIGHYIQDYQELQGPGVMRLHLKGPLKEPEQLSLTAELLMQEASLFDKDLGYHINGLNGTIHCFRVPDRELADVPKNSTLLRFEQLKG